MNDQQHDEITKGFEARMFDIKENEALTLTSPPQGEVRKCGYTVHYVALVTADGDGIMEAHSSQAAAKERYTEIDVARIKRESITVYGVTLEAHEIDEMWVDSVTVEAVAEETAQ